MRAILQRVLNASVHIDEECVGEIGPGLLVLLGAAHGDEAKDLAYILNKTVNMRIFQDDDGKMNHSLLDTGGQMLVVSQFTLYGDARKGRRPSFMGAMHPDLAEPMVEDFITQARALGVDVQTGRFGADMQVSLINDGPVTILLESDKSF